MDDEDIITAHEQARSMRELQILLGYSISGATATMLKKHLDRLQLTVPVGRKQGKKQDLQAILVVDSQYSSSRDLKRRLINESILVETCSCCGVGNIWHNNPLTLQLDHINGIHSDNRLENLQLLCPNCHSQTPTWGRKAR